MSCMLLFLKKGEEIGHKKSMPVNDIVKFITNDYIFQLPVLQNCKLLLRAMQPMTNEMLFPLVLRLYEEKNCTIEIRHCTHNTATSQTCIPTGTHTKKKLIPHYSTLHYTTQVFHTHAHKTLHTHVCMHARTHMHIQMHKHRHAHTDRQTCTDRQTDKHAHTHTHMQTETYTYSTHTQACTHRHTHTCTHRHTQTCTQTQTDKHTPGISSISIQPRYRKASR